MADVRRMKAFTAPRWIFAPVLPLFIGISLLTIASNSCGQDIKPDPFVTLGHLDKYLEFPANREQLDKCFADNNRLCLSLYASQRAAVADVFSRGRPEALRRVLDAISKRCGKQAFAAGPLEASEDSCRGATTFFYFFRRNDEDIAIVNFLKTLEPEVLWNMFVESKGYSGDWVSNRPNRSRWLNLIRSLDILDRDPPGRTGYENIFLHPSSPHSGVALLDPGFELTQGESDRLKNLSKR